jgi:hypothetical protein
LEHQLLHFVITTMDLPRGWSKATYKNAKTGEKTCYYFNKEGLTSRIPPPPSNQDDESSLDDDGDDSSAEDTNKKIEDLRMHFPQPPPKLNREKSFDEDIFEPKDDMVRASILRMEATTTVSQDKDNETAISRTFDPENMLKRILLPKCVEAGIPDIQSRMNLADMKDVVRKFFIELHRSEGTSLHESNCYVAKAQSIERKRKETSAQKRKNNFAAKIARNDKPLKVAHPNKKKGLKLSAIMAKFPDEGFYIVPVAGGGHVARCACNQKIISGQNKDYYSILKHVETTKKHAVYIQQRKLSQQKEARLSIAVYWQSRVSCVWTWMEHGYLPSRQSTKPSVFA